MHSSCGTSMMHTVIALGVWAAANYMVSLIYDSDHMVMNDPKLFAWSTVIGLLLIGFNHPGLLVLALCSIAAVKFLGGVWQIFTAPPAPDNVATAAKPFVIEILRLVTSVICWVTLAT